MKKLFSILIVLGTLMSLCACGGKTTAPADAEQEQTTAPQETESSMYLSDYAVPDPIERPDYSFDHMPTNQELRQMAVDAMEDMLTVQWCVDHYHSYRKGSGANSNRFFRFIPENIYSGMPYTNGNSTLIHWFEYYDPETGRLNLDEIGPNMDSLVGNSCAACVTAGWTSVCASANIVATYLMTPGNGYVPVGDYKIDETLANFKSKATEDICQENGEQVMFASYAQIRMADGLTSTADAHAIMAKEDPVVVYREDGTIDPEQSTLMIQDQRAGTSGIYYVNEMDGQTVHRLGRIDAVYTFQELYDLGYLPMTTKELAGLKEYEMPWVELEEAVETPQELLKASISSNYNMYVVRIWLTDEAGNRTLLAREARQSYGTELRNYSAATLGVSLTKLQETLEEGKTYTLSLEAVISNGQTFTVAEVPVCR